MEPVMKNTALIPILAALFAAAPCLYAQNADTVSLVSQGDVISQSMPTAKNFYVKEIPISERNKAEIQAQGNFTPSTTELKFFYGEDSTGSLVGTVLFLKMETQYGPIEVGVVFAPAGAVSNVVVTEATAETVPWVKAAENANVAKALIGISSASASDPLKDVSESAIGTKPYFIAQVMATAAIRGAIYYNKMFLPLFK